jgi:hypothetical protein
VIISSRSLVVGFTGAVVAMMNRSLYDGQVSPMHPYAAPTCSKGDQADMKPLGFIPTAAEWEGPVQLLFSIDSEHTKTVRYRSPVGRRAFDLYAPLFLLRNLRSGEVTKQLVAAIGKSADPLRTIGFFSHPRALRVESDLCEFEFSEAKVNSQRYDLRHANQTYALYVPNEIFQGPKPPRCVYLRLGVLTDELPE